MGEHPTHADGASLRSDHHGAEHVQSHAQRHRHHHDADVTDMIFMPSDDHQPAPATVGKRSMDGTWTLVPPWVVFLLPSAQRSPGVDVRLTYPSRTPTVPERPPRSGRR